MSRSSASCRRLFAARWSGASCFPSRARDRNLASLTTKATEVDGGWRITGQKIWTTAAQFSQWGALLARTNPSAPKHNGITYFLLDMKQPGVEVKPLRELTGNALFNTVFIDDVFVPDELVLGEVGPGLGGQPQYPDSGTGFDRQ
jgi:alkylation response protein AidB-like acyl-CoA dehydrogenase